MADARKRLAVTLVGGGSQNWTPKIIRDILFKPGLEEVPIEFRLLDTHSGRAKAMEALFKVKAREWKVKRARFRATRSAEQALEGSDFVIITISTGRLEAMAHDLAVPERYGLYHTVGDTAGPGGWSRALRNIPVFADYARRIRKLAPDAFVLNYTNPLGALTKVLADELGRQRVVGLCHGFFENLRVLMAIFGLQDEREIQARFGGLNHFFWILDFQVRGEDGYALLRRKLRGRNFAALVQDVHQDGMGFHSDKWLTGELLTNYGYLPYVGDRHTCEFFNWSLASLEMQKRFKLVRTTIAERRASYERAEARLAQWTRGEAADGPLTPTPSRETAADIIHAITFNRGFTDVVNLPNIGQIANLPMGAVVETMGYVDGSGFTPLTTGALPEPVRAVVAPHAEVQVRTVAAGLSAGFDAALLALEADPVCGHLPPSDIRKMGMELLAANRQHLPQFFGKA